MEIIFIFNSGMVPIIRAILEEELGKELSDSLEIIANGVEYSGEGGREWNVAFRHPETCVAHY